MKRFLCSLLIATLCLGMLVAPALAATAQYSSTQDFLDALDASGIDYTNQGVYEETEDELVRIEHDEDGVSYVILCSFDKKEDRSDFFIWNLIDFDAANRDDVLYICNDLNLSYKYVKFYVDDSDNSVTAYTDLIYGPHDRGDILTELLSYLTRIVDIGYNRLAQYDITA